MKVRKYGELIMEAPRHLTYFGSEAYLAATGVDMVRYVRASHRSDTTDYILEMFSHDNGQSWREPQKIVESWEENGNLHTRATTSTFIDIERGITIQVGTETRQDEMVVITHLKYTRPIYRFSFDGGKTWTDTKYLIQDGDEYDLNRYAEGITYGKRMAAYPGTGMIKLTSGKWLMPYQTAPLDESGEDFYNPYGAYGFFNIGIFIGTWNEAGDDLIWEKGQELTIDADLSSRGLTEPGIVQLKEGRIVMVMRGSNSKIENQKGVKWVSISEDEGRTWATPYELTFDDGSTMYSPASINKLIRHSNGKIYWSGNIVPQNPAGNMPRYPLQVAELDEDTLTIKKDTVQILADKEEGDCDDIQFSNYGMYENRSTHELVFTMCAFPEIDYKDWTGHLYRYRVKVS